MALFEREEIMELLSALADRLAAAGEAANVWVVGSAAITIEHGDRPATRDIDAGFSPPEKVRQVAAELAAERGLPEDWLNDKVKMWMPHDGIREWEWKAVVTRNDVTIRVAPPDVLLAMKLRAGRGQRDATDIHLLLDVCEVTSIIEAEEIFQRYLPQKEITLRAAALLRARFGDEGSSIVSE